jgi:precorrin-3B C17-methyltransferase
MCAELHRCATAIHWARQGHVVALVSSGDAGIYGMAAPTFELLAQPGLLDGAPFGVEVIPGVTALSACAALAGAPLTHDFCAISLSDRLTPWPVIEKRLVAAAMGDFVTALYNPQSGQRTWQLGRARDIFLEHRAPHTPVAVVTGATRPHAHQSLTTLALLTGSEVGMQTLLLIGNASTKILNGRMVTPRGYADKYDLATAFAGLSADTDPPLSEMGSMTP